MTDAELMEVVHKCQSGGTKKFIGDKMVVYNYDWWCERMRLLAKNVGEEKFFALIPDKEYLNDIEIIHCRDCVHYKPPHVRNEGKERAYRPGEIDPNFGFPAVFNNEGINVGGQCHLNYQTGYDVDKRVFCQSDDFCSRAKRRDPKFTAEEYWGLTEEWKDGCND